MAFHEDSTAELGFDIDPSLADRAKTLSAAAKEDALSRLPEIAGSKARARVENAIDRRFYPHVLEGGIIAAQLTSERYRGYVQKTQEFLDVNIGATACPDGRILTVAIVDPRVGSVHRRLQGLPDTRPSTHSDAAPVLEDPDLTAAIENAVDQRVKAGKEPSLVEFIGPHIYSSHPEHGCGARTIASTADGRAAVNAMRFGGIKEFFDELGTGFYAFETVAKRAHGQGSTFDLVHDAHAQSLIVGLREAHRQFNPELSLRENLLHLHDQGQIVMSEMLDAILLPDIVHAARAHKMNGPLDIYNPTVFAHNMITIGEVAREVTRLHEQQEFPWIPEHIRRDKPDSAIRALAYTFARNSSYRLLSGIKPGAHRMVDHPETSIRVGPIGAAFNVREIAFIQNTPHGAFSQEDIDGAIKLYGLAEGILPKLGVDLKEEGRLIMVTKDYDPTAYADTNYGNLEYRRKRSTARSNAAAIRERLAGGIHTGDTVVIGALHRPGSSEMIEVV